MRPRIGRVSDCSANAPRVHHRACPGLHSGTLALGRVCFARRLHQSSRRGDSAWLTPHDGKHDNDCDGRREGGGERRPSAPEINVVDWRFQRRDRSVSALLCGTCSLADQDFQAVTPQEGRAPLVKLPHWRVRQFVARTLAPTPNGFEADPLSITSFRDVRQQNWMPASSFRVSKQRHGKKSLRDWPR